MQNKFIQDFRKEFMNMSPQSIISRSVNGLKKWFDSNSLFEGFPIHVKGAILYNHLLKEKKLQHKYPFIQEEIRLSFYI